MEAIGKIIDYLFNPDGLLNFLVSIIVVFGTLHIILSWSARRKARKRQAELDAMRVEWELEETKVRLDELERRLGEGEGEGDEDD